MQRYSRTDILAVSIAGLGIVCLFGDELWNGVLAWKNSVRNRVEEHLPLDYEIERARRRTAELATEIVKHREVVVRQTIDVANLKQEIADQERQLVGARTELMQLRESFRRPESEAASQPQGQQLAASLETAFETYRLAETTVDARREILDIRLEALLQAQAALRSMESQRRQLQLHVENLGARLELVRAQGSAASQSSPVTFADCKSQLRRLDSRLRFLEGMLDAERAWDPNLVIALETAEPDIASRIDEYFGVPSSRD